MATTVIRDVLSFHKLDREVYDTLVARGSAPAVARNVVALFKWLELAGVDVIPYLYSRGDDHTTLRMAAEAESILHCIRQDQPPNESALAIPLVASLVKEPITLRFFYCHRDVVVRGITQVLDGIGALIFDDYLYALLEAYEAAIRADDAEAGRTRGKAKLPELPPELAKPFDPRVTPLPEDCRSMFVTFSKGFPLKREDIIEYFTEKWGSCVEKVMMERTAAGVTPMYGRIVFTSEAFVALVLHGEQLVKFTIKGRQLWARKYVPRNTTNMITPTSPRKNMITPTSPRKNMTTPTSPRKNMIMPTSPRKNMIMPTF